MSKAHRPHRDPLLVSVLQDMRKGDFTHAKELLTKDFEAETAWMKPFILNIAAQIAPREEFTKIIKPFTDELKKIRENPAGNLIERYQESSFYKILAAIPTQISKFSEDKDVQDAIGIGLLAYNAAQAIIDPTGLSATKLVLNVTSKLLSNADIEGQPELTEILHMTAKVASTASFALEFIVPDLGTIAEVAYCAAKAGTYIYEHKDVIKDRITSVGKDLSDIVEILKHANSSNIENSSKELKIAFKELLTEMTRSLDPDQEVKLRDKINNYDDKDHKRSAADAKSNLEHNIDAYVTNKEEVRSKL